MQLAPAQLAAHLKKGLRSLYVLHGDEPLLVQEAQDAIRATARAQGHTERSVFTVQGAHFDWGEVLAAGGSLSLFADKQVIELRIPSGKPGKEGSPALQQLAEQAVGNDSTLLVVMLPRLDRQTKTSAWFAALEANGASVQVEPVERKDLPSWIAQRLALVNLRVADGEEGQRSLQFFADRVEGNLLAAHQEIQKLALLFANKVDGRERGQVVTKEDRQHSNPRVLGFDEIEQAVLNVARYDVFKLSESVLAGQMARTQRMIDGLQAEGVAEVLVHWALSEDIRALKRVKDAMGLGQPLPMALRDQRVWGVKERLFERVLPRLTEPSLRRLLKSAHLVDGIVKGLKQPDWPADPWVALQRLALMLCKECANPQAVTHAARKMAA